MTTYEEQRDIEAEGQRAAIYHAKKASKEPGPFSPAAIEALYLSDIKRATETFNALIEQAERDRASRLAHADRST